MAASSSGANTNWEPCAVEYFRRKFVDGSPKYGNNGFTTCAENSIGNTFDSAAPYCGDGLVQGHEECDCINNDCLGIDSCCVGATCQFVNDCSALDACCDSGTCLHKTDPNIVCRAAANDCDFQEKCTGTSGKCPVDAFADTGVPCVLSQLSVNGTCYAGQCLDMKKECVQRGLQNDPAPLSAWTDTCRDEVVEDTCIVSCKQGTSQTDCQFFQVPQFFKDGTQCKAGKGCSKGVCTLFSKIPLPNNPNCTNGFVDQNETDIDCGGPACFGCASHQLCFTDGDCSFPGNCNKTTLVNANGYIGLGRCSDVVKPSSLEDTLNAILRWFAEHPEIWAPILGVLTLLILLCCCCPRGKQPPIAKAGMFKAQESFRQMRGERQPEIPTAMMVKD